MRTIAGSETGKTPIALIPYANMGPFRALGPPPGCRFVDLFPRRSTRALQEGLVQAAPVPVGDLTELADTVRFLGAFGIAASGAVRSVLLLSSCPLAELVSPARLYLTNQSSSSIRLLYLLLGRRAGFDRLPVVVPDQTTADGELLIGDDALLGARTSRHCYITDLAAVWRSETGLPFVFARWVIRRDAPPQLEQRLLAWLAELAEREQELVQQAARNEGQRLGMTEQSMLSYLRQMTRVLGEQELAGQQLFLEELRQHGRTPLFQSGPVQSGPVQSGPVFQNGSERKTA